VKLHRRCGGMARESARGVALEDDAVALLIEGYGKFLSTPPPTEESSSVRSTIGRGREVADEEGSRRGDRPAARALR